MENNPGYCGLASFPGLGRKVGKDQSANRLINRVISGVHIIISSKKAEADRAFFKDTLGFPFVDAGEGWLIFSLPPSEFAVHPAETNGPHELFLMCKDLKAGISDLKVKGVRCSKVQETSWGSVTKLRLPGGGVLHLYQPKHQTANPLK